MCFALVIFTFVFCLFGIFSLFSIMIAYTNIYILLKIYAFSFSLSHLHFNSPLWITKIVYNSICLFLNLNIITRNAQFISYIFITWPTIIILHYLISQNPSYRQHIFGMNLLSVAISKILHLYFILFCLMKFMLFLL